MGFKLRTEPELCTGDPLPVHHHLPLFVSAYGGMQQMYMSLTKGLLNDRRDYGGESVTVGVHGRVHIHLDQPHLCTCKYVHNIITTTWAGLATRLCY